jgi:hypothetical protein
MVMGRTYIHTLGDCKKHGLVLEITCLRCRRAVYRTPNELIGFQTRCGLVLRGTQYLDLLGPAMRCKGGKGSIGCGAKGARIRAVWPHELKVPAGVPVIAFLNGDDRERKRLIRIARG